MGLCSSRYPKASSLWLHNCDGAKDGFEQDVVSAKSHPIVYLQFMSGFASMPPCGQIVLQAHVMAGCNHGEG